MRIKRDGRWKGIFKLKILGKYQGIDGKTLPLLEPLGAGKIKSSLSFYRWRRTAVTQEAVRCTANPHDFR